MFGRKQRRIEELEESVRVEAVRAENHRVAANRAFNKIYLNEEYAERTALLLAKRLEQEVRYLRGDSVRVDQPPTQPMFGGGS